MYNFGVQKIVALSSEIVQALKHFATKCFSFLIISCASWYCFLKCRSIHSPAAFSCTLEVHLYAQRTFKLLCTELPFRDIFCVHSFEWYNPASSECSGWMLDFNSTSAIPEFLTIHRYFSQMSHNSWIAGWFEGNLLRQKSRSRTTHFSEPDWA